MYSLDKMVTDISLVPHNFVMGNKVYINDEITYDNCSYLLADLNAVIQDPATILIEFFINSPGGDFNVMLSIVNSIKLAKRHKILVNTYVSGEVGSAASMLATFGDVRYMNEYSQHFIHFGSYYGRVSKETEIKKLNKEMNKFHDTCKKIYLKNTKIPVKLLDSLMEDEQGYLDAKQCLKYKICDEIL